MSTNVYEEEFYFFEENLSLVKVKFIDDAQGVFFWSDIGIGVHSVFWDLLQFKMWMENRLPRILTLLQLKRTRARQVEKNST